MVWGVNRMGSECTHIIHPKIEAKPVLGNDCLSSRRTTMEWSKSPRAAMNDSILLCVDPDGSSSSKERVSSAGNTSRVLSLVSSPRAAVTRGSSIFDTYRFCTALNGRKSSSHWEESTSFFSR